MRTTRTALAITAIAIACTVPVVQAEEGPLRVGLEAPLSGPLATLGDSMLTGAQLAAMELNRAGGVLGRTVTVIPIDDGGDKAIGVPAAEAAIAAGLDVVVGPYNSGVGIETLPLYIDAGIVPVRLTSNDTTSGLGYTLQPMTYQIAPVAAHALDAWIGAKNVALLVDETQNYTVTIADSLVQELGDRGVTVTRTAITPGLEDYTDVAAAVLAGGHDAVYLDVYTPEGGRIAKALHAAGSTIACLADYATYDTGYVEYAGLDAARACDVVGVPAPDDFPGATKYLVAHETEFGRGPGSWTPYTYDSTMLLADGIERAGSTEFDALSAALDATTVWAGWTGAVSIDPATGDRVPATVVVANVNEEGELHVDADWADAVDAPF